MCQRQAGGGGRRGRSGDARHDFVGNTGLPERLHLLAGAAEDERIAALKAYDFFADAGHGDEQGVDLALGGAVAAGAFAHEMLFAVRRAVPEQLAVDQIVAHHDLGFPEQPELVRLHGSGTLAQIEHLAQAEAVPANFLAQILGKLRTHGLITSRRGSQGGYTLARPPEEISLHDILLAVEGGCLHLSGNFQGRSGRRLKQVWAEISETLEEKTKSYTLDQLRTKNPAGMYYI